MSEYPRGAVEGGDLLIASGRWKDLQNRNEAHLVDLVEAMTISQMYQDWRAMAYPFDDAPLNESLK